MTEKKYISVGKISKPHGIHGALIFVMDKDISDESSLPNHFLILNKGIYEPLFVQSFSCSDAISGQITFEGISNRSDAERLNNKELFLSEEEEKKFFEEDDDEENFIGFTVIVADKAIGTIKDIEIMPMQELFVVAIGEKEVYIPFVDDFITAIDYDAQTITFDLPDGLLEL